MAIAIAQGGNAKASQAGIGTTGAVDFTGATLIVAVVCDTSGVTFSDNQSNSYTPLTQQTGSFGSITNIYYVANPVVSSGMTFTLGNNTPGAIFVGFSGVSLTSPYDGQENGATNVTSPSQPGSITPVNNDSLIVSGLGGTVTSGPSSISGMTLILENFLSGGVNFSAALAYVVQTGTPSALNPTWTYTASNNQGVVIASFKPASGTKFILIPGR